MRRLDSFDLEVEHWFKHFRENGFPFPNQLTLDKKVKLYQKLVEASQSKFLENNTIYGTKEGISLAWSYFPHRYSIKSQNFKSPVEAFNDDLLLKLAIEKSRKLKKRITPASVRDMFSVVSGTRSVSNFRPISASVLYKYFNAASIWDMSSGFGGRLLGAMSLNIDKYTGTDPSTKTYDGLCNIQKELNCLSKTNIFLYKLGSEDYFPVLNSFDLCFTSPPYFNCEHYSEENTQSYIKYPTKEDWLNGFLKKTIENCFIGLEEKGILALNIAPVSSYKNICDDVINISLKIGFIFKEELKLALCNTLGSGSGKLKYEPVLVFRKFSK